MSLIIAGERSGVGKTTVTLAMLSFLSRQGSKVQSFKVGPDYIDPMFHTAITDRPCRNLDPVLTSESYVRSCFASHCQKVDYALVEGVMGLFDGVRIEDSDPDFASTAHIARLLDLPIVLVIDCSRLSGSVAAIAHGYRSLDPRINLAGVILNRVGSDRHLSLLKDALEPLNLPILGILRRQEDITIPDRHLGLIPSAELEYLETIFERLAHLAKICFDWEKLLPLLKSFHPPRNSSILASLNHTSQDASLAPLHRISIKIAIARDRAFNFYYQDNLDILEKLGAELIFWSPIEDERLPEDIGGLYFGGGFPEVFAEMLADNILARTSVRQAIVAGMPTYAECGGLMYLCEKLIDFDQQNYPMVGILPTTAVMGKRLTLGYRRAIALNDSLLFNAGESIWGHEFHRSQLTSAPQQPIFDLQGTLEGWHCNKIHASYVHLHFGGELTIPQKFLDRCLRFSRKMR
ncbi:cobyrinate a,c-diamide synthase [Candidatus Gracilibacteria bacterium]|nr:cobyrinate a,c-diamide synthase [Candidatus Gracilibacteria bacterium]NJP21175.1 cobyrinate a,c-diamide synthase [Hydrococcus sp. CRU_1_1]